MPQPPAAAAAGPVAARAACHRFRRCAAVLLLLVWVLAVAHIVPTATAVAAARVDDAVLARRGQGQLEAGVDDGEQAGGLWSSYTCCRCTKSSSTKLDRECHAEVKRQGLFSKLGRRRRGGAGADTCAEACARAGGTVSTQSPGTVKGKCYKYKGKQTWPKHSPKCGAYEGLKGRRLLPDLLGDRYCVNALNQWEFAHTYHGLMPDTACHWDRAGFDTKRLGTSYSVGGSDAKMRSKYNLVRLKAGARLYATNLFGHAVDREEHNGRQLFLPRTTEVHGYEAVVFTVGRPSSAAKHDDHLTVVYYLKNDISVLLVPDTDDLGSTALEISRALAPVAAYATCVKCQVVLGEQFIDRTHLRYIGFQVTNYRGSKLRPMVKKDPPRRPPDDDDDDVE